VLFLRTFICFFFIIGCFSCAHETPHLCQKEFNGTIAQTKHAKLLDIKQDTASDNFLVSIKSNNLEVPETNFMFGSPSKTCKQIISTPFERIVIFSSTHVYMLDTLQALQHVIAFSNASYTGNNKLLKRINSGDTKIIGEFETCDLETLLLLEPDLIIISGNGHPNAKVLRLQEAGITVIENNEWMESTPLGRAEWIKLMGLLVGKYQQAYTIFNGIEEQYESLTQQLSYEQAEIKTFIYGAPYGSSWYVPGELSFMSHLLKDTGIDYFWPSNGVSGGFSLDLEQIILDQQTDSIWISPGAKTRSDIAASDKRLTDFTAFKTGKIFNYDKRLGKNGTSLFWEESVLRCDLLLSDFATMTRPNGRLNTLTFFRLLD